MAGRAPLGMLNACLAEYDPAVARIARSARARLHKRLPGAVELIGDTYTGLAIGFGPTGRPKDAIISLVLYPRWVNLFFLRGTTLEDPASVLQGKGSRVRHIRLDHGSLVDDPRVARLIARACAQAVPSIDPTARRRTITFASTAKRRPRRPAAAGGGAASE
ncbi:MAG TPA: hypothetical protein VI818_04435 [Candidatus Thermoplasmatota archaeon]|nr:hypothetical protein [Candidatus Thermoplasmatota archaeon]